MQKINSSLALILVIHIILGIAFSFVTPIFEPPDESNHYLFVRYLQLYRALPVQTLDRDGPRAHHPPLYFFIAALAAAWVPVQGGAERIDMQTNPNAWFRYGDPHIDNKAVYIHYTPDERWPFRGQALAVHMMRLVSVAFAALGVWFTYAAALEVRPGDSAFALLGSGLVAFNTMVLFMAGAVQNNTAALASGVAILWVLSWGYRRGFTVRRWLMVGVTLAIGILLQTSALTFAVCIGLVLLAEAWRTRRWRTIAIGGFNVALPVLALVGWWFWRNYHLYGDFTANSTIAALWTYGPVMPFTQALYLIGTGLVGRVGQGLMIDFPAWMYYAVGMAGIVAAAGLIRASRAALQISRAQRGLIAQLDFWLAPERALWFLHVIAIIVVTASLFMYMYFYIHGLHGRYLFPVFPSIALLMAGGGFVWIPRHRRPTATGIGLALALALPAYSLFGLLAPTYAPPHEPTLAELHQLTPLDANIGDVAQVLGYRLNTNQVAGGDTLAVTVAWRPLMRTDRPYTVFIHLLHPAVGSLTQRDTYPGLGNWATTVWDVNQVFVDTYRLTLPKEVESLAGAQIILGLYDATTMQRLPVTGANAGSADEAWVQLGSVRIQP